MISIDASRASEAYATSVVKVPRMITHTLPSLRPISHPADRHCKISSNIVHCPQTSSLTKTNCTNLEMSFLNASRSLPFHEPLNETGSNDLIAISIRPKNHWHVAAREICNLVAEPRELWCRPKQSIS